MDPTWVVVAEGLDTALAERARALLEGQEIRCTVDGRRILVPPADAPDAHVVLSALSDEEDLGGGDAEAAVDEATLTATVNEQRLPGLAADALVIALRSVGIPAKTDGPGASRGSEIGVMPEVRVLVAPGDLESAKKLWSGGSLQPVGEIDADEAKRRGMVGVFGRLGRGHAVALAEDLRRLGVDAIAVRRTVQRVEAFPESEYELASASADADRALELGRGLLAVAPRVAPPLQASPPSSLPEPPTGPSSLTLLALFAILAIVAVVVMKACT